MTLEAVEARNSRGQTAGNGLILQWACEAGCRTGCYHRGRIGIQSVSPIVRPPSTGRQTPVTKSFSAKNSTAWATFSGRPRPLQQGALYRSLADAFRQFRRQQHGTGNTALTRTFASSTANMRVIVGIAPFETKYVL